MRLRLRCSTATRDLATPARFIFARIHGMDEGSSTVSAVALLDVLGFKRIERNSPHSLAADTLKSARTTMSSFADVILDNFAIQKRYGRDLVIKRLWFSDTIFIVANFAPPPETPDPIALESLNRALIDIVTLCVQAAITTAARAPRPLAFRGAITVGPAIIESDDILFGEAIAEAADIYELAEGAFVWLSPKTSRIVESTGSEIGPLNQIFIRYPVPIKTGCSIETMVVRPGLPGQPGIRAGFERAMEGDRLDVVFKRQNTLRFLDHHDMMIAGPA